MLAFPIAREADAPVIAALRQRCWAASYRGVYPDEMIDGFDHHWHAARDLARIRDAQHIVRLITLDDRPIGYIILTLRNAPLLMSLYILPEHHRLGVGSTAFALIRDTFGRLGHSHFTCQCLPSNAPARAFYERMGGVLCGEDSDNPEPWQNAVIYRFQC